MRNSDAMNGCRGLAPLHLAEFEASAISPELALANAWSISGPQAAEQFLESTVAQRQRVGSYITAGNARLIQRYAFLEAGAWIAFGITLDGAPGDTPYAKPDHPRWDEKRNRPRKYENAPGLDPRPLLPDIDPAWDEIAALWKLDRQPGESCWEAILNQPRRCPVVITEGWKKALALSQQGIPAVALRGITQWHPKGEANLWPEVAALVAGGRKVFVCFDQDSKPKTRKAVAQQARKLATAVTAAGGKVHHVAWDGQLGKGIDDALVTLSLEERQPWILGLFSAALSPKQQQRQKNIEVSREILSQPEPMPHRVSLGDRYIDPLPPLRPGVIHWVTANMGGGKTVAMGRDWARAFIAAGGVVVVLSPLNSLGQQTAQDWSLPHIHDYSSDATSQQALRMDIRAHGGIIGCINSAPRMARIIPQDSPLLLVIDEAGQTLGDAASAGTLKRRYSDCWEAAIQLMQRAVTGNGSIEKGAIALAEDGLSTDTINLVQVLSGCDRTYGIDHKRTGAPWAVRLYRATATSAFRGEILTACEQRPQLVVTSSKAEAKRLERAALERGINAIAIHADSNESGRFSEFFENPDQWLATNRPQLLIISPSGKTGLSIEGGVDAADAYFEQVWGYFPGLDLDCWLQLLGRYRPPVPRQIWAAAYINPEPGEKAHRWVQLNELHQAENRYAAAAGFSPAPADSHDSAIKEFLAARRQRAWASKIRAADALADALTKSGHNVTVIRDGVATDAEIAELWDQIKIQLATESAEFHAALTVDPVVHTEKWATKVLSANDAGYEQRCMAVKVRLLTRFPGMNWDCAELWYEAIFRPRKDATNQSASRGPLAPGAALWAEGDYSEALWAEDAKVAEEILSKRLKATHLLPKAGLSAKLTALLKPHAEALLSKGEIMPGCPHALAIKQIMLKFAAEAHRVWRVNCTADQSEVAIANKVMRKFGLVLARAKRVAVAPPGGGDRRRQWSYFIEVPILWIELVKARRAALANGTDLLREPFNKSVPPASQSSSDFSEGDGEIGVDQGQGGGPPAHNQPGAA